MKSYFKRFISAAAVLFLISTLFVPVYAADTDGLETAIVTAKSKINVPDEYSKFTSDISDETSSSGAVYYNLNWTTEDDSKEIQISVSSYGDIISYSQYDRSASDEDQKELPRLSVEDVKNTAYNYVIGLNPSWAEQLPFDKVDCGQIGIDSRNATAYIRRYVNGVSFYGSIGVSVDVRDGSITNYWANWSYPGELEDPAEAISASDAAAKFEEYNTPELVYVNDYDYESRTVTAKLVYKTDDETSEIDAITGEKYESSYSYSGSAGGSGGGSANSDAATAEESSEIQLTEEELANLGEVEALLNEAELRTKAEEPDALGLSGAEYNEIRYRRYTNNFDAEQKYRAYLDYTFTDGENEYGATITMDAETGEILGFYRGYDYSLTTEEETLTVEEGRAIAEDYMGAYYPKYSLTKIEEPGEDAERYNPYQTYIFYRYTDGIRNEDNYVTVTVDLCGGGITNLYEAWDYNTVYESSQLAIDAARADELFAQDENISLEYIKPDSSKNEYKLVYSLNNPRNYISAVSGAFTDSSGEEYIETPAQGAAVANDIAGHYAEKQIKTLLYYNVLGLEDGAESFRPDDIITKRELASFVVSLERKSYVPVASGVDSLENSGVAEEGELESDDPAKREDGVKYIINALGYKEVAQLEGIYTTPFLDEAEISQGYIGYVALAKGMNIISGDENSEFNPQEGLTRADAAIMIYNYLVN